MPFEDNKVEYSTYSLNIQEEGYLVPLTLLASHNIWAGASAVDS